MGKKKSVDLVPQPFSLKDHLDIPAEAARFEVPEARVVEVAEEVQTEEPPVFISLKIRESELKDKFRDLYNIEIQKREMCAVGGCGVKLESLEQAIAHLRWHHMNQDLDPKLSRATMLDVEAQVYSVVEAEARGILEPRERKALIRKLEMRRNLIQAHLDEAPSEDADE